MKKNQKIMEKVKKVLNKEVIFYLIFGVLSTIIQFLKFMSGRAFTLAVEFFGGLLLFKIPIPNMITKTFLTVIVVILNYFISKYFAFNSKSKDK